MPAGLSARHRSAQLNEQAEALFTLFQHKRQMAESFAVACESERVLADVLRPLDALGWQVFEDRRWPGSKRANVDFVLVGPGGVVILDAKHWGELEIRNGSLFRGDACEDGEVEKLVRLTDSVCDAVSPTGLTPAAVLGVMVFTSHRVSPTTLGPVTVLGDGEVLTWLAGLRHRLTPHQVVRVAEAVAEACPAIDDVPASTKRVLGRSRPQPRAVEATSSESLIDVDAMTQALVDTAMAGPIEDWMTFLHPDQSKLIRSRWNGPARVRGPAGTGKTVVGLHRAVYLAERSADPVLFVSFVKTLPVVLASLAKRLSEAASENIEFSGVHALAFRALELTGQKCTPDPRRADHAFRTAWRQVDGAHSLGMIDERPAYWREEIDHVIKGRGLSDFAAYRDLQRVGRRTRLRAEDRGSVWDLYVAYEAILEEQGTNDFNDLLIKARSAVEAYPDLFRYSAVIVDEVQDLNLVALQFLNALAGEHTDQLLIIGDGQQSVYPGGFNLTEAGISVTGRASVLRINYRNTYEIVAEAARLVSADSFEDLDGELVTGVRDAEVARHGHRPIQHEAANQHELEAALVAQVRATRDRLGVPWGDMAVLLERRKDVEHFRKVLTQFGVPHVELTAYDGLTTDRLKIGTIKRSKGLEFKYVLMPGLRHGDPDPWPGETTDAYAERCERLRRELYVGMTRARDGLWLGYHREAAN